MSIELRMLLWSVALGLVQIALAATYSVIQRSLGWAAGPRDNTPAALTGIAGRLDRARGNFLETFPLFAALTLAVIATGRHDDTTALGAQLYFWARLAYVPAYAAGIPYLRTLIWAVSVAGIVALLASLLG